MIEFLKGREPAVSTLPRLARAGGIGISLVTYGEVYDGIYHGQRPVENERGFKAFLRQARVVPIDRRTMRWFGRLRGQMRTMGKPVGDLDLLIAATALRHDLTLVTHNRAHFARVPGLRLYAP